MLTIRKIRVPSGDVRVARRAADYVLNPRDAPEALARPGDVPGRASTGWLGSSRMLGRLGVSVGAPVHREELTRALQGCNALTGERVRVEGMIHHETRDENGSRCTTRVPGTKSVDLTFSAPKSVSLVWSQAEPALRQQVEEAMLDAAAAMLANMTSGNRVVADKGTLTAAKGFAAAAALHVLARAARDDPVPAPQLHVHGIVVGVERGDGFFASPELSGFFKRRAPLEGGAVARLALAERLVDLGFTVEPDGRYFAVRGVPKGLADRLSGRSREVEREVADRERQRGRNLNSLERSVVALQTRRPKNHEATPAETVAAWAACAAEFDFDTAAVEALRTGRGFNGAAIAASDRIEYLERAAGRLRLREAVAGAPARP